MGGEGAAAGNDGRGLNCVPFLTNFFNLSRLGQLITEQNDFPRCLRRRRRRRRRRRHRHVIVRHSHHTLCNFRPIARNRKKETRGLYRNCTETRTRLIED